MSARGILLSFVVFFLLNDQCMLLHLYVNQDEDEEAYLQTYVSGDENGAYLDAELSQDEN